MPTVLRIKGYQFYFYAEEGTEPPHIHVDKGGGTAKFWLSPIALVCGHGLKPAQLQAIRKIIEQNQNFLLGKWNEFFER